MPFSVAKKIIDYEMSLDTDKQVVEFDLFGGEPFLEFELIKQIAEYLENGNFNKDWIIFTTTNGTLVHGEIQEWLKTKPYFIKLIAAPITAKLLLRTITATVAQATIRTFGKLKYLQ